MNRCRSCLFLFRHDQPAGACSVGQQQMIEIAKALMIEAKAIIMDEPTSPLTDRFPQRHTVPGEIVSEVKGGKLSAGGG